MKSVKFSIVGLTLLFAVSLVAYPIWVFDWESITSPYNIPHGTAKRISVVDDKLAWAVGDSGLVAKRDGPVYPGIGERVWEYVDISSFLPDPQDDYDFHDVFFFKNNNQLGWIVGELRSAQAPYDGYGIVLRTTDGGTNWEYQRSEDILPTPFEKTPFYCIDFSSGVPGTGYIGCGNRSIIKTEDGGGTWTQTDEYPSDNVADCFVSLWVGNDPENIWAIADNSGLIVKTLNGGGSWVRSYPDNFKEFYDVPDVDNNDLVHLGSFSIDATNISNSHISLSDGYYGYTTDGGNTWNKKTIGNNNIWNYGIFIDQDTIFNVGSEGVVYNNFDDDKETWWKFFNRRDIDISEDDVNDPYFDIAYTCGAEVNYSQNFPSRFARRYNPVILDYVNCSLNNTTVTLEWQTSRERNTKEWRIGFLRNNYYKNYVLPMIHIDAAGTSNNPITYSKTFSIDNYDIDFHVFITLETEDKRYEYFGPFTVHPQNGQTVYPPNPPDAVTAQDVADDNGGAILVEWDYYPDSDPRIPRAMDFLVLRDGIHVGHVDYVSPGHYTFIDDMSRLQFIPAPLTGIQYTYKVLSWTSVFLSDDSNLATATAIDNIPPDPPRNLEISSAGSYLYMNWQPPEQYDSTFACYWVCPERIGRVALLNNLAPIERTWYVMEIPPEWEVGWRQAQRVLTMDRSGQFSAWVEDIFTIPLSDVTGTDATYANNGERLQRDANGNMYLAFTSGNPDSIYFSQSSDGGAHWTKESVAEGSYPVLMLYGSYLHLLWIKDKTTDQAKLMYAWKSISDEGFSTGSCLLNINADPTIESMGPPSLAISQDSLFVTWESRMSPPLSFYSGLFVGSLPNTRAASPPIHYEMLGLGSLLHTICPSEIDTIMESVCPSTSVDKRGNPYIVWDRINPNTGFFDIVAWERTDDGDWFSEVISNTADCADEEEPYLTYENGVLHCVWSGTENNGGEPFNIYHSQKYPGQPNERWGEPEIVYNSEFNSSTPVYERGHIIWSEDEKNIMMVQYDYGDLEWQTSPPETIAMADNEWNVNPVATSGNDSLFIVWSNKDKFNNYYIHYDEKPILEISPRYAVNTGLEEEGAFTVERDGNQTLGEKYYKTIDHSTTNLIYKIRGLDEKPGQDLKLIFYHEFNDAIKLKVKIDHIWMNIWVQPAETVSVEEMIPVSCLADGEIKITIKSVPPTQNAPAVCSAIWFYDETGGGGPMSSGERETPLIYSLKTPSPSPFKDNTTIYYSIAKSGKVSLKVYDITGRCIKIIENGIKDVGRYSVRWNGCDNNNHKVATGVYFTRLTSRNFTSVRKVILVR